MKVKDTIKYDTHFKNVDSRPFLGGGELKHAIEEISGLKFMIDALNLRSSTGRRYLHALPFLTNIEELEKAMNENAVFYDKGCDERHRQEFLMLEMKLGQLRDIKTTIRHLLENNVLDDIELFEIKHLAILAENIREITDKIGLCDLKISDLSAVIDVLDPEKKRIPHFYIYNQYSEKLAGIRKKIELAVEPEKERLLFEAEKIEDEIRGELTQKLFPFADALLQSLNELAKLDVSLAKAEQTRALSLVKPKFTAEKTSIQAMFHPQVAVALKKQGKVFQRIDMDIPQGPTVITGANMAGKSVLLKTVALVQTLAQFGFYVPAAAAEIVPVEKIFVSMGDGQNEMNGLSSFASEMLRLNETVQAVKKGTKLLVLIDELARTTNPTEGKAIVCGALDFLMENRVRSLVTTHYSINLKCKKLRVKGFLEPPNHEKITIGNINNYIDYSLEETTAHEAPNEAIRVAEIMGVDAEILRRTKKHLH